MYNKAICGLTPSLEPLNDCQFLKVNPRQNKAEISKFQSKQGSFGFITPVYPFIFGHLQGL